MFSRARWKPIIALAAILIVGVVTFGLLIRKAHERKEFVGNMDRGSGYRCHFTVSSDLQRQDDSVRDITTFTPVPPSPLWHYIESDLLHRPPSETMVIVLEHSRANRPPLVPIDNGYPDPVMQERGKMLSLSHLRIDQCPATIMSFDSYGVDTTTRCMDMYVYVPNGQIWYKVSGTTWHGNYAVFNSEMEAIISSFHVEKVVASVGKR